MFHRQSTPMVFSASSPIRRILAGILVLWVGSGCAAVRPEQRAMLADPTMRHEDESLEGEARQHILENREGAIGGGSVQGGGCGCN